jgi:acyl dehydratase
MPRLYFEDFLPGETLEYGAYPVTKQAILIFARQFDPQPFHLDEDAARASLLGGLAASGWHTAAMVMRINCDAFLNDSASTGGAGIKEVRWLKPVRPGDILSVRRTTIAVRNSASRPLMGLVEMICDVRNQNQDSVMSQQMTLLLERRNRPQACTPLPKGASAPSVTTPITQPAMPHSPQPATMVLPFAELAIGAYRELGHYRFGAAEIIAFAQAYDPQPFHLDEALARQSFFGGLIASGWHTAAVWMKLLMATRYSDVAHFTALGQKVIEPGPSPGFRDLKWLRPVYADDTITYATQLVSKRMTSRPGWGIVSHHNTGDNQKGEPVIDFTTSVFWPTTTE